MHKKEAGVQKTAVRITQRNAVVPKEQRVLSKEELGIVKQELVV
jgi:hypothetical protein